MMSNHHKNGNLRRHVRRRTGSRHLLWALLVCGLAFPAGDAQAQNNPAALADEKLEDLMNIEVTSVSKTEQKLSETASAIFVITQEDIRNSGASNVPDLLRMVPGLDVARINSSTWAISARGQNNEFANELLVLVDGRSVYTPFYGGVYWDAQDFVLEDIDRIEVICGPGGAIWGENAVNGVINIITKRADKTQGALVTMGGGTSDEAIGQARYGGQVGKVNYRVFTSAREEDGSFDPQTGPSFDAWSLAHGGFRTDTDVSPHDKLTVQGDLYEGQNGQYSYLLPSLAATAVVRVNNHFNQSGGNIEGRWDHQFSSGSDMSISYYHDQLGWVGFGFGERRKTDDVSVQRHIRWGERQDIIGGAEYRYTADRIAQGNPTLYLVPVNYAEPLSSLFAQDSIALLPHRLTLTVGAKLEHNVFTGFKLEPDVRIAWTPDQRYTMWGAISNAERAPDRADTGLRWDLDAAQGPGGIPIIVRLYGNPAAKSEGVDAYEAGFRSQVRKSMSLSVSTFFNSYSHQRTYEPGAPFLETDPQPIHIVYPENTANNLSGNSGGLEASASWKATSWWSISPGYSLVQFHFHTAAGSPDVTSAERTDGSSPEQQAQIRSHFTLPNQFAFDWNTYFVDRLPALQIPAYTRLDLQLTRHLGKEWEISAVGQNLLSDHHAEFRNTPVYFGSSDVRRSVFVKLAWRL
jgi:iron complex outermembrane recepter protein